MTSSQPVITPDTLIFTPDNKHAFVNSGTVGIDDNETTFFEITTSSYYLVGHIQFTTPAGTSDDLIFKNYLNGSQVSGSTWTDTRQNENINQPIIMIIPPFTTLKTTAINATGSGSRDCYAMGTFKVFGAIESGYQ